MGARRRGRGSLNPDADLPRSARDHWEREADGWIALTHADPQYELHNKPAFLEVVPAAGRLTVEVGCGEGRVARELIARGHRVVGVDAAPALARAARGHRDFFPVAVADIGALPVATGVADVVVCFMVLMDVEDLDGAVGELARVLAPGGALCVGILHPIMTSGLFVPGDEFGTFYMGEYLKEMRHELEMERRTGGVFRLRVEHRPVERYFRAFAAAGLVVDTLREPSPSDELVAASPEFANAQRVPNFLHIVARHAR
jgi:SAM-dependent methyltransferase